jgi:TonB family protein
MGSSFRAAAALVVFFAAFPLLAQQSAKAAMLHDRLTAATVLSSLDASGLPPWHLKLDVTLFDDKGENPIAGSIEVWHANNRQRTVFTFGSSTRTLLDSTGSGFYASHSGSDVPVLADTVLDEFLRPGPQDSDIEGSTPEFHKQKFGSVQLDCIMLARPFREISTIPPGLFHTFCLVPSGDRLLVSYGFGYLTVVRGTIGAFQGKEVSTDLVFMDNRTRVAEAKAITLETFTPSPDQFQPDAAMRASVAHQVQVSGGVIAGHIFSKVQPVYPESARTAHIGGTVLLHAIIGRDGRIRSLVPESAPSPDLAISAMVAIRQWLYTPYLLNGEPTEVDTTITVNYNLNSR